VDVILRYIAKLTFETSTVTPSSCFMNIACCPHTLSGRFSAKEYNIPSLLLDSIPGSRDWMEAFEAVTSEHGGRYSAYLRYLAELSLEAGYVPEREALRIPSVSDSFHRAPVRRALLTRRFIQTRNFAIIGRRRVWDPQGAEEGESRTAGRVDELATRASSAFKPRPREGKYHD
jgi:tRNASer (uridine44-2'-O)-methyltransferase